MVNLALTTSFPREGAPVRAKSGRRETEQRSASLGEIFSLLEQVGDEVFAAFVIDDALEELDGQQRGAEEAPAHVVSEGAALEEWMLAATIDQHCRVDVAVGEILVVGLDHFLAVEGTAGHVFHPFLR